MDLCEFRDSLVYKASSRMARTKLTQRDPVLGRGSNFHVLYPLDLYFSTSYIPLTLVSVQLAASVFARGMVLFLEEKVTLPNFQLFVSA